MRRNHDDGLKVKSYSTEDMQQKTWMENVMNKENDGNTAF